MCNLKEQYYLTEPTMEDEEAMKLLITKWKEFGGRMNPGLLKRYNTDYREWLQCIEDWSKGINIGEKVPQTLFFLKNREGTILGATSLRHYLNHTNIVAGGHVAYGICPEYRGCGYGKLILNLALKKLSEMGIEKTLVTCDTDNIESQKVILYNGGVLENQTYDEDGISINRYWIDN
ncbi:GNAT family N-acetyltransferase [Romboutsia sp.]|uniref:GNAT family N-acetyltransferase n=1 Tax=Romboutsia sp. TaxID=1965302 RepID=UPI003F2A06B8